MANTTVKIEQYIFDCIKKEHEANNINITDSIYDILKDCSYYSENDVLVKKQITLYFTDEQLDILRMKQEELGYENNFTKFVRYALFEYFMSLNNVVIPNKFFGEPIDIDKLEQLLEKCKNVLINGEYTAYDLDLLRNNEKYKGKISFIEFDKFTRDCLFSFDFLEYDMLSFLEEKFKDDCKYSKLVGLSTNQNISEAFITEENEETLEPFVDYDNIVPDTDSFYYLYLYYIFVLNFEDLDEESDEYLDIDDIFDETDDHITSLLERYTFEKILRYNKDRHNIEDLNIIFDEECLERLKSNELINFDDVESDEVIESDETDESDENVEVNEEVDNDV